MARLPRCQPPGLRRLRGAPVTDIDAAGRANIAHQLDQLVVTGVIDYCLSGDEGQRFVIGLGNTVWTLSTDEAFVFLLGAQAVTERVVLPMAARAGFPDVMPQRLLSKDREW